MQSIWLSIFEACVRVCVSAANGWAVAKCKAHSSAHRVRRAQFAIEKKTNHIEIYSPGRNSISVFKHAISV